MKGINNIVLRFWISSYDMPYDDMAKVLSFPGLKAALQ